MLRVVLDTNVFVSSLLVKVGVPAQALDAWRARRFVLVTSPAILAETRATLNYNRIRRKYNLTDDDVEQLLALLQREALLVPGTADVTGAIAADPSDEKILACALDGRADLIVSGNLHLLDLGQYGGVSILNVRQFLERLAE
ncbi:MAG: putative toxin-antitoxin system toxin component, PIN family [Anaerolineae bacterium]|nr:putative toxin-antitoxin system toxin component, PIN family [Anaerolineae bacterium]